MKAVGAPSESLYLRFKSLILCLVLSESRLYKTVDNLGVGENVVDFRKTSEADSRLFVRFRDNEP